MRTPKPASIRCSLVTSAQPRRQLRSCWVAQERDLLAVFQFNGQPYFDLAGELGVFALSDASTVFQRVWRSNTQVGASAGAKISLCSTPRLWV